MEDAPKPQPVPEGPPPNKAGCFPLLGWGLVLMIVGGCLPEGVWLWLRLDADLAGLFLIALFFFALAFRAMASPETWRKCLHSLQLVVLVTCLINGMCWSYSVRHVNLHHELRPVPAKK
jgi:hypothetical protein